MGEAMIEINAWLDRFLKTLENTFGDRVWFVGLQGSYGRGEASDASDIDVVVILDALSAEDVKLYRAMLDTLSHRELVCGFFSGRQELLRWAPSDLFQFYYDTKPIRGSLDALLPSLDASAIDCAIRIGVCNLYHGCVHNLLHGKSEEILRGLYKSAVFVVQAVVFKQTGKYVGCHTDLLSAAFEEERCIVETYLRMKRGEAGDFESASERLLAWAQRKIQNE